MIEASGSIHRHAGRIEHRELVGRLPAYAIELPLTRKRVVVRHNTHGGLLASLRGDLFMPPTRAPRELRVSARLVERGVPTPRIVGYAVYEVGPLRRSDVVSEEIGDARDFGAVIMDADRGVRVRAVEAVGRLLSALRNAGARHLDLNVKNVLLRAGEQGMEAWVIDVDRVRFSGAGEEQVHGGNVERLRRSVRKWVRQKGAFVEESELTRW
jgi:tRNA A-37 threonylcarbamoyl transferase component Bud32